MAAMTARGLSPLTVRGARATLRRALSRAVRNGLVTRNVASLAAAPRVPGMGDRVPADPGHRGDDRGDRRFDEYGPAWAVAVTTGVRLGELCGLQWPDVDLAAGTLTVRRALARTSGDGWALAEHEDDPQPPDDPARRRRPFTPSSASRSDRTRLELPPSRAAPGRIATG